MDSTTKPAEALRLESERAALASARADLREGRSLSGVELETWLTDWVAGHATHSQSTKIA